jgi:dTDP-4-dehydrorhamnose reductase
LVTGAAGIIGQWMMLTRPRGIDAIFARRSEGGPYLQLDLETTEGWAQLDHLAPDVIVNLAGENRVDVVEKNPLHYKTINQDVPGALAEWCRNHGARMIQVSTQGVFSGQNPPYGPKDEPDPIHHYGRQKAQAEADVLAEGGDVARLTFVIGIRPFGAVGRQNPLERMFELRDELQVYDHRFSIAEAHDSAVTLWDYAVDQTPDRPNLIHIGGTEPVSRYDLAQLVAPGFSQPVSADFFDSLTPRPPDTTWSDDVFYDGTFDPALAVEYCRYLRSSFMNRDIDARSGEISIFLDLPQDQVRDRLAKGFHHNHALVAQDFRAQNTDPEDDGSLLDWYTGTDAYIWELSAYHLEEGFNYRGMCQGVCEYLKREGKRDVLVLGDGIGDLTLDLAEVGLNPIYHDLTGSLTAEFAQFRFELHHPEIFVHTTGDFVPRFDKDQNDAVVALDFFEHLPNVEDWVRAVYRNLRPGGLFLAQNAFAIGDVEEGGGSIPCHLSKNNKYVDLWDPLLQEVGFRRLDSGWWQK